MTKIFLLHFPQHFSTKLKKKKNTTQTKFSNLKNPIFHGGGGQEGIFVFSWGYSPGRDYFRSGYFPWGDFSREYVLGGVQKPRIIVTNLVVSSKKTVRAHSCALGIWIPAMDNCLIVIWIAVIIYIYITPTI